MTEHTGIVDNKIKKPVPTVADTSDGEVYLSEELLGYKQCQHTV